MENIDFKVSVSNVITFLGKENFETKESAVYELVKNAYDAEATNLSIKISKDKLIIEDDGVGMNEKDIKNKWMQIGQSYKRNKTSNDRVFTGEKGIGRLALARLGGKCELHSNTGIEGVHWVSDWETNKIAKVTGSSKGTKIIVKELSDCWTDKDIQKLNLYLTKSIKSTKLKICVYNLLSETNQDEKGNEIRNVFNELEPNINYFVDFKFEVIDGEVVVEVNNKLFDIDMMNDLKLKEDYILKDLKKKYNFRNLNGVKGHFYYGFRIRKESKTDFSYRPSTTDYSVPSVYDSQLEGIILYRNEFSVQGYDGGKDWAELATRQQKFNKAISDSTGRSAFRKNNIFGYVEVDKFNHSNLKDLSNRQGLVHNDELQLLINLVDVVFEVVEVDMKDRFYVPIRRKNKEKVKESFVQEPQMREDFNQELVNFKKLNQEERKEKYKENEEKRFTFEYINEIEEEKKTLKRDSLELETYSTQSILINSVTHDLKNNLSIVGNNPRLLKNLLKLYKYEEGLILKTSNNKAHKNYLTLIEGLKSNGEELQLHLIRLLNGIKREKFNIRLINIDEYFQELSEYFTAAFATIHIEFSHNLSEEIKFYETTLDVIFNNLIDNSRKNNKDLDCVNINIELKVIEKKIYIHYKDDGIGLNKAYKEDTSKIFVAGETSHPDKSPGLGMWIVNRRVKTHNGKIKILDTNQGFATTIEMEL